jgi:hypothetical protein
VGTSDSDAHGFAVYAGVGAGCIEHPEHRRHPT